MNTNNKNWWLEVQEYCKTGILTESAYNQICNHCFCYLLRTYDTSLVNMSKDVLAHDMATYILTGLLKWDSTKSNLKTFIKLLGTSYLNKVYRPIYTLKRKGVTLNHMLNEGTEDEIDLYDSYSLQQAMERDIIRMCDNKEFVQSCLFWWVLNTDRYFQPNSESNKAVNRIIQILITKENLEHKNFIKMKLGISKQLFSQIVKRMRKVNKMLFERWQEYERL